MSLTHQIWIADSARMKGVQNLGLGVQKCTKWVQNYDPVFYPETAFREAAWYQPRPNLNCGQRKKEGCTKFGTWCIKFFKMSTKLWSSFLCWNYIWCWYMSLTHQIWIADSARMKGVQNLGLGVQNCTKLEQNYDPVFYVETAFGGLHVSNTPNFNFSGRKKGA